MKVGIALGSNLGDRAAHMEAGFEFLGTLAVDGHVVKSSLIESSLENKLWNCNLKITKIHCRS